MTSMEQIHEEAKQRGYRVAFSFWWAEVKVEDREYGKGFRSCFLYDVEVFSDPDMTTRLAYACGLRSLEDAAREALRTLEEKSKGGK